MSNSIILDDLGAPRLTELQQQVIAGTPEVTLSSEAVLAAATAQTGLSNFGSPDFRERLDIWMRSFNADTGLHALGRATVFGEALRYAVNRLRLEDLTARNPDISSVPIDRPIIIAGLPRSGTTHLVNVLAADPRLRSMQLWESMEPIPSPDETATWDENDPRFRRTAEMWGGFETMLPLMPAMHEMAPDHVHEDIDLQGIDFSSYLPEWLSRPHEWREHYYNTDQTPHYQYARRVLRAMTWLKGPNRWVMKSPPHMENLPAVLATYPDATVVVTHRDPVAVIQSAITMIAYGDRIRRKDFDLPALAEYWTARIERMLRACVRDRALMPQDQVIDVLFHEYMADQQSVIDRVYDRAGLEMNDAAAQRIQDYLNNNPRGKHGTVVYDLPGHFGVDVNAMRERFAFYYDAFPVRQEKIG